MTKEKEMENLIDRFKKSGMSRKSFCEKNSVNLHKFKYWEKKLIPEQSERQSSFVKVKFEKAKKELGTAFTREMFEIEYPNGVRIKTEAGLEIIGQLIRLV